MLDQSTDQQNPNAFKNFLLCGMAVLVLLLGVLLLSGCSGQKGTGPSGIPPRLPVSGSPSNTVAEIVKIRDNEFRIMLWGNLKLGLETQPADPQDSLSGGTVVIRDYSCGSLRTFVTGYANSTPRENSDTTLFTSIVTCGNRLEFEVWVETFKHERIQHQLKWLELQTAGFTKDTSAPWRIRGTVQ